MSYFKKIMNFYYVLRTRLIFKAMQIISMVMISGMCGVYYFEKDQNENLSSVFDVFYFMLVTMSTVGYGDKSPVTLGGRLVVMCVIICSVFAIAAASALSAAVFVESKLKEEMGMKTYDYRDHVVLVGWNLKGDEIVSIIKQDERYEHTPFVIIANVEKKPIDLPFVSFVHSDFPVTKEELAKASIEHAKKVVLLADYTIRTMSDTVTITNCLMVRHMNPSAQIYSELLHPKHKDAFEAAGANVVIGVGQIGGKILAKSCLEDKAMQNVLQELS